MTDRVIRVVLDSRGVESGVRRAQGPLGKLDKRQKGLTSGFRAAAAAATAFAGALATREIIRLTNTYQSLQNQLRIVTDSQEQLNSTSERLFEIAQATRQPLESVTQLFSRASIAAEELGASEAELFRLTEITGKALAVQGSSAAESSGALRQLSQAFSSGIVRAEEFNSILEGAFPLAQAAARGIDEAGGSVARLRQLIVAGEITSQQFFDGLLKGGNELDTQFAKSLTTISQAMTQINNSLISFVGGISNATGAGDGLASVLTTVSETIDDLGDAFAGTLTQNQEVNGALQLFVTVALIAIRVVDALASSLFNVAEIGFTLLGERIGGTIAALVQFAKGNVDESAAILEDLNTRNLATINDGLSDQRDDLIGGTSATIEALIKLWDTGARDVADAAAPDFEAGGGGGGPTGPVVDPED
ncbi:MAG: tape measure protein, partial [Hyphomicrobiaceae bacterium]|nr:tape measure protein [Hyphomicrobiaceae bacterium]